jgi:hypothetical protein
MHAKTLNYGALQLTSRFLLEFVNEFFYHSILRYKIYFIYCLYHRGSSKKQRLDRFLEPVLEPLKTLDYVGFPGTSSGRNPKIEIRVPESVPLNTRFQNRFFGTLNL